MEKISIAIVAWVIIGLSIFAVGTVIPAGCTPAYTVDLTTVDESSANNVTEYTDLPSPAQKAFEEVRSGNETTVDSAVYDKYFAETTIKYSDTYYRVVQGGSLDCGTPMGTLLQYAGLLLVALMSLISAIRWLYKNSK